MKNLAKLIAFGFFIVFTYFLVTSYHKGTTVEELKTTYMYSDSKFLKIAGKEVHVRDIGQGEVVILLHGIGSSLHTWKNFQDSLAVTHRVISLDLPGFGLTGPFEGQTHSLTNYMNFLDKLYLRLEIDKATLVGSAFGGYLAWNYALKRAGRVSRLVLFAPTGLPTKEPVGFYLARNILLKELVTRFTPRGMVYSTYEKMYGDVNRIREEMKKRYYDLLLVKGNREAFSELLIEFKKETRDQGKIKRKLRMMKKEVLLIWGNKDERNPLKNIKFYGSLFANSQEIDIEGAGHLPMEERPDEAVKLIKIYLD